MATSSYDCDYDKPYSPESLEPGDNDLGAIYTPSPVRHCASATATSRNAVSQADGETDGSSSSVIIDLDDAGSTTSSVKASSHTEEV
ncbi:unnamed protein product [Gongylonema pulchrum]|uniref:Uncharacterized protein n=1 Tax=Gongylonema pulchrum TaxID=637853 RepID=A0A183F0V9_9BILA|nr:unnamed protein product [Gongylonema pulchrum]